MNTFLEDILSGYWWISVVIVGILINLVSNYISTKSIKIRDKWSKERRAKLALKIKEENKIINNYKGTIEEYVELLKKSDQKKIILYQLINDFNIQVLNWKMLSFMTAGLMVYNSFDYFHFHERSEYFLVLVSFTFLNLTVFAYRFSMKLNKKKNQLKDILLLSLSDSEKKFWLEIVEDERNNLVSQSIDNFLNKN